MSIEYDRVTDSLRILLSEGEIAESDEIQSGIIVDYDRSDYSPG